MKAGGRIPYPMKELHRGGSASGYFRIIDLSPSGIITSCFVRPRKSSLGAMVKSSAPGVGMEQLTCHDGSKDFRTNTIEDFIRTESNFDLLFGVPLMRPLVLSAAPCSPTNSFTKPTIPWPWQCTGSFCLAFCEIFNRTRSRAHSSCWRRFFGR